MGALLCYNDDMTRRVGLAPGEFYHVYNRGTDKRSIFKTRADYERFVALLYLCNQKNSIQDKIKSFRGLTSDAFKITREETLSDVAAYCLMPNHFHLILREREEGGISKFMQKLTTGFTMYFNKRHQRSGTLFESTFKSSHVDNDVYLKYLIAYVHLNPVKLIDPKWKENGIRDRSAAESYLKRYLYSSYLDYAGAPRPQGALLTPGALPQYFQTPVDFEASVTEWLTYKL